MMAVEVADVTQVQPIRDQFAQVAGEIVAAAWAVAVVGALPLALRVGPIVDTSTPKAWLAIAALCLPASLAAQFFIRAATLGFRAATPDPARRNVRISALALWIALSTVLLGVFAIGLSAVTHHRGLGATTFAIVGVVLAVGCSVVAMRIANLMSGLLSRPAVSWVLLALSAALPTIWIHLALRQASEPSRPGMLAVADACLFAALAVLASRIRLPASSLRYSVPTALVLTVATLVAGVSSVSAVARGGDEAHGRVLLLAPVLDRISEPDAQTRPRRRPASAPSAQVASPPAASTAAPTPTASSSAPAAAGQTTRIAKPDIVLVTLDSVRADHLSAYGYERPTSPNLAELAKGAVVFERAYAAGPETRTALAPVLTGRWLEQCARDDRAWPTLLRANETLAERLRAQGYVTGAVSSFQWLSEERGAAQGFDIFDESAFKKTHPEKGVTGARAIAQAMDVYAKLVDKDRPIFLWVHLFDAHKKYLEHADFDFGRKPVDLYDGEIAYVDRELGRLMTRVSDGARAAKTVWIVHGSNGEAFGEHGFDGHPAKMYEEVIRVPLIMKLPWAAAGRVTTTPVSMIDLVPTVIELAAGTGDLPGVSLLGLAEGRSSVRSGRNGLLVSYAGIAKSSPVRAWIDGDLKLVVQGRGNDEMTKLFDLSTDAAEQKDVAPERGSDVDRERKAMDAFVRARVAEVPLSPAQEP